METTTYRVFTAPKSGWAQSDRKHDFDTFEEAQAYATKHAAFVTGFKKVTTSDVEWRA